jgi:uncharacterized protein YkwD
MGLFSARRRRLAAAGVLLSLLAAVAVVSTARPVEAASFDANAAEQQLFNLINQDRTANGFAPLTANPTLFNIARGAPHQVCGGGLTLHGRAQDMIERNYFSHQIPPCNSYVWPVLQSYGVQYTRAGENIVWNTYAPQSTSVDSANTWLMNSAPHKANILGDFNQVGVGAWAAPGPWSDGSGTYNGVMVYVEIFAKVAVSAPATPANLAATPANGSVNLSWSAPSDGGSPLTGYTVTPYVAGVAGAPLGYGPGSTSVRIPALVNGTAYSFTVSASNAVGSGPASAMSNTVTPLPAFPYTAVSAGQYRLSNSDGASWVELDSTNLRLTVTPSAPATASLTTNADLWTVQAGINQDLGIFVSSAGGPDSLVAWKESGGSAGTFSPNAAFVQGTVAMAAGVTYTVKLKWKANIPTGGMILAGAGPFGGAFSPTRLSAVLVPTGLTSAASTKQYQLANSDGSSWSDLDAAALALTVTPSASGTAFLGGNADLWTAAAGVNQDLGIFMSGGAYGAGRIVAWKESGGNAGTFSPNAAFVQAALPVSAGTVYQFRLQWKANRAAPGATIFAGAGPIAGQFSPTSLTVQVLPASTASTSTASTSQYHLTGNDGSSWTDIDATNLALSLSPSGSCLAVITGNADLWTATAGYNQDLGIDVNGALVAWKESGGFAGTFSPNAAFVQAVVPMATGSSYTVKLRWKTNKPAGSASIYAGAGPIAGQFSPTSLSAELICG